MIGLQHYLTVSAMLFVLSIVGIIINRKNLILLLAIIAAITLTMRKRPGLKVQNIAKQVAVRAKDRVRVVKMDAEKKQ